MKTYKSETPCPPLFAGVRRKCFNFLPVEMKYVLEYVSESDTAALKPFRSTVEDKLQKHPLHDLSHIALRKMVTYLVVKLEDVV